MEITIDLDKPVPDEVHEEVVKIVEQMNEQHAVALFRRIREHYTKAEARGKLNIDWY